MNTELKRQNAGGHRYFRPRGLALCFTAGLLFCGAGLRGQNPRAARDGHDIARYLARYDRFVLEPAEVERRVRSDGRLSIPTVDGVFDIVLMPHDMRAPAYWAEDSNAPGLRRPARAAELTTYRGFVEGLRESEVRFTVRPDGFEGLLLTRDEWYFVEPVRNYDPSANASEVLVYRASDIRAESFGECGTTLAERIGTAQEFIGPRLRAAGGGISIADVATEADYEYVTAMGGADAANGAILEILNQADGIYQSQLSLSLRVVFQHTWSTLDDPYTSTNPSTILGEFRSYWGSTYSAVDYDLAHMWTGKDMDGSAVGIAYLGVVCNARSYSFGVSQRFNPAPGKYILTAHEIGHNFGATHSDQVTPVPADCPNTIMNSSIGTGTTFCQFSKDEIATHVAQSPSCLAAASGGNCDITRDGQVNVLDVQTLANIILGAPCPGNCDVNQDGRVDILDLQRLVNIVLGLALCP